MHKKWFLFLLFLFTSMTYAVAHAETIVGEPGETDIDVSATVEMTVASPQIKALVPTYLSVQIDPNQKPNYSATSEGGFISSYGQFRNDGTIPLDVTVQSITPKNGAPSIVPPDTHTDEEWQTLTMTETTSEIAIGLVLNSPGIWNPKYVEGDSVFLSSDTPIKIGTLQKYARGNVSLMAKYGLAWPSARTIEYELVFKVSIHDE